MFGQFGGQLGACQVMDVLPLGALPGPGQDRAGRGEGGNMFMVQRLGAARLQAGQELGRGTADLEQEGWLIIGASWTHGLDQFSLLLQLALQFRKGSVYFGA